MFYPDNLTFVPMEPGLSSIPGPRKASPFRSTLSNTLVLLTRELRALSGSKNRPAPARLHLAVSPHDLRKDGLPRAGAVPYDPAIVLHIDSEHGTLVYPCANYFQWQDNLRAVALTLEALRKVERYGASPDGRQYTGFLMLPTGSSTAPQVAAAEAMVRAMSGSPDGTVPLSDALRAARLRHHPDTGGTREDWDTLSESVTVLTRAGRV